MFQPLPQELRGCRTPFAAITDSSHFMRATQPCARPSLPLPPGLQVKWFSPFLLAVWDPVAEEFQSLCRCMSGFTDEFYAEAKERLSKTIIPGKLAGGHYLQTRELVLMSPLVAVSDAHILKRHARP